MLFLLDANVRTVKWNGIPLHEASSAIVKEETNGDFYLTVRYPITDSGIYQLIKEDMLIKSPVPVLGAQLFRIKKPIENDDSMDITAYHVSDDIMKRSITPVSVVGQGCAMALSQMVQNAKTGLGDFSFTSDIMDSRTFNTTETETLYSVLMDGKHSIVGTWEGELVRDNFALSIKRSRGADRGVVITTHKNLKSYQRTKNSQGVVTRIHARSTFKPDGAEDEVTLRVSVDSPLINSYPYINEKEYENNNAETVEDLRKWAEAKFTNEGIDKVSDAIEIEAYELDGQVVNLGDTVNLKSRKHSADLYKKAIAYEFNALTEEYISITFDDKPGVGGSGVSSGLSNVADAILVASATAQDVAVQRAVKNANAAFDAEFGKTKTKINDDIEIAKAKVESFKSELSNRMDNQLLPLVTEAKNLASQAQADLTRKEIELRAELNRQVTSTEAVKISLTNLSHNMDIIKQKALNDLRDAETRLKEADSVQQLATKRVEDKLTGLSTKLESFSVGGYNYVIDGGEPKELMANFYGKTYDINPQLLERTSQATLSFSYEAESTSRLEVRLYKKMHTGDTSKITIIVMPNFDLSPGKGFISQSFDLGGVMPDPRNQAWLVMRGTNANPLTLSKVKLERGTVATDWNNRDETLKASFAEYKQTVDENLANLRTSTETLAGQLTSAESSIRQTSESFSNRLVSLETYKDSEPNRASRYFEASKSETAKQLSALRTEVNGSYVDKSTYEENARGLIRRFESLSSGTQNYALGTERDVYLNVSGTTVYDLYSFGTTLAVKGIEMGDTVTIAFNYFADSRTAFGSYELELYGHAGKIERVGEVQRTISNRGTYTASFVANNANFRANSLKIRFTDSQLKFRVTTLRVTKGTIPADWSPSPDDLKAYSDTKLEQTANEIKASVTSLDHKTLKQTDITMTSEGIVLRAGKTSNDVARAIGSYFKVTPDAIALFSSLIKVSGNMLVDGSVTSRKLVTGAVETGHVKAGAITGVLLAAEAVTAEKLKVDQAFFNKLMANDAYLKQLFAKSAFITQVQSVTISASQISGGVIKALNNAMEIQMNSGQILYYTDQAALKRVLSGYPTQFVKFATGTVSGKGNAGVTVIGSNRYGTESTNDGGFVGVRAWNGSNIDSLDLVGDEIRLASSAFDNSDGWDVRTLDSGLKITPHNRAAERNSRIEVGDVWILKGNGSYSSLRDILNSFNENFSKGPNADSYTYYPSGF